MKTVNHSHSHSHNHNHNLISAANEINQFCHCHLCLEQKPPNISPRMWAQLEVGFTPRGLQVWCKRHEVNVCHIDFEGQKHPANLFPT